jgi:hypothetical protein
MQEQQPKPVFSTTTITTNHLDLPHDGLRSRATQDEGLRLPQVRAVGACLPCGC